MTDLLYVFGTVAFFAAMLAYVAGCARLGRTGVAERSGADERQP